MTSQEAVEALSNLPDDPELAHMKAERIIIEFLASNGMGSVSDAFEKARIRIGFWYA